MATGREHHARKIGYCHSDTGCRTLHFRANGLLHLLTDLRRLVTLSMLIRAQEAAPHSKVRDYRTQSARHGGTKTPTDRVERETG